MRRLLPVGFLSACLLFGLSGCWFGAVYDAATGQGVFAPVRVPPVEPLHKNYQDETLAFDMPYRWKTTEIPDPAPNVHTVAVSGVEGVYCRLTVLRNLDNPGSLPFEVIQSLQRANPAVQARPFSAELGGLEARGYQYSFEVLRNTCEGWVVSWTRDGTEFCCLAQYPGGTLYPLRGELLALMRSARLK